MSQATFATSSTSSSLDEIHAAVEKTAQRGQRITIGVFALIFGYLAFSFYSFDVGSAIDRWNPDRAAIFALDSYAYKDHVLMTWDEPDDVVVRFEGARKRTYDPAPEWYDEEARIVSFPSGASVTLFDDHVALANWPGADGEIFIFTRDANGDPYVVGYEGREDELPAEILATETRVQVWSEDLFERIQVARTKVEIHRYQVGWKYFWFDFDSPLSDYGLFAAIGLMFSGDRVDPEQSNFSLVMSEFLSNDVFQHGPVLFALLETVLMALIGTMIACLVGLPLAFMAAKNVQPLSGIRFVLRRLFDTLRGVDTLIWSLIFLRAFGPGLFTGIFAIAFTDTGTLGKLMSEAIENSDPKQQEGVQSTGATKIQQHRFGIVPQIMPVFISQSLYYLESNTRGAVIIGAMGAGGIGLEFLGALQTGSNWENVAYMSLLILLTVILIDTMSARLRRSLIGIEKSSR